MRQLIIARKDLGMSSGKLAAQCCHASEAFLTYHLRDRTNVTEMTDETGKLCYKAEYIFSKEVYEDWIATVYKGNTIKNLIMDCQSYTKYRPNETTGGIFV